jgi:long-chain acyl-CoA synthetase
VGRRRFPNVEIKILDEQGRETAVGEVGEIYLRDAPEWTFEYNNNPEKTAACRRGDYFTLGDMGYLNAAGYLFLTDRKNDVINYSGVKLFPAEIEQALLEHPAVIDCAVIGVADDVFGEVPKAVVQTTEGVDTRLLTAELIRYLAERLAAMNLPRYIEFNTELPRAPNGKIYRRLLREGAARAPAQPPS